MFSLYRDVPMCCANITRLQAGECITLVQQRRHHVTVHSLKLRVLKSSPLLVAISLGSPNVRPNRERGSVFGLL